MALFRRSLTVFALSISLQILCISAGLAENLKIATLDDLMKLRQSVKIEKVNYKEIRHISLMAEPLLMKGQLEYEAPDHIKKITTFPFEETLDVQGHDIKYTNNEGLVQSFDAEIDPLAYVTISGLQAVLSGNYEALQDLFFIKFGVVGNGWLLHLRPREPDTQKQLLVIRVSGVNGKPSLVEIFETSGDRTSLNIFPFKADQSE